MKRKRHMLSIVKHKESRRNGRQPSIILINFFEQKKRNIRKIQKRKMRHRCNNRETSLVNASEVSLFFCCLKDNSSIIDVMRSSECKRGSWGIGGLPPTSKNANCKRFALLAKMLKRTLKLVRSPLNRTSLVVSYYHGGRKWDEFYFGFKEKRE